MDTVAIEPCGIARDDDGVGLGRGSLLRGKLVSAIQDTFLL